MSGKKQLVVNADDFGFTRDVNRGIIEAHQRGILTATTLMANGDAFEDAVRLAGVNPKLDVGAHLVLIGGRSLAGSGGDLPISVPRLLAAIAARRIRIYDELAAVARVSEEFGIRWVRRPFDLPLGSARGRAPWLKRAASEGLGVVRARFHRVLAEHHCRTTDHFAGFQITGRLETAGLVALIGALPEGSTELMCHPGRHGEDLRRARTRLKESRERELTALMAPEARQAIEESGVELVNYRTLDARWSQ